MSTTSASPATPAPARSTSPVEARRGVGNAVTTALANWRDEGVNRAATVGWVVVDGVVVVAVGAVVVVVGVAVVVVDGVVVVVVVGAVVVVVGVAVVVVDGGVVVVAGADGVVVGLVLGGDEVVLPAVGLVVVAEGWVVGLGLVERVGPAVGGGPAEAVEGRAVTAGPEGATTLGAAVVPAWFSWAWSTSWRKRAISAANWGSPFTPVVVGDVGAVAGFGDNRTPALGKVVVGERTVRGRVVEDPPNTHPSGTPIRIRMAATASQARALPWMGARDTRALAKVLVDLGAASAGASGSPGAPGTVGEGVAASCVSTASLGVGGSATGVDAWGSSCGDVPVGSHSSIWS